MKPIDVRVHSQDATPDARTGPPGFRLPELARAVFAVCALGVLAVLYAGGGEAPPESAPAPAPPVGTILPYAGPLDSLPPDGAWLPCDGRELRAEAYPALFAAVGTAWGGSAGGATFRVPDLRGRFVRGVNHGVEGEGRDPEAAQRMPAAPGGNAGDAVGTLQLDSVGPHAHTLSGVANATGPGVGAEWIRFYALKIPDADAPVLSNPFLVGSSGGAETRPANAAVNWIIRAR